MAYTIKSLGFGQVAVLLNGKHVKRFGGPSAPTDARMFINKQHQDSLPKERAPGMKDRQVAEELFNINSNISNFNESMLEAFSEDEINEMIENYEGFEKLTGELKAKGAKSPEALAAWIGRKKYGKKKFQKAAAEDKSMKEELDEKKLTPAELKKREEIARAIERENPGMEMGKKMAIATAQAKKVAEATDLGNEGDFEKSKQSLKKAKKQDKQGNPEGSLEVTSEETETDAQLDELNKSTLASYVRKAGSSLYKMGGDAADAFSDKDFKKAFKIGRKADNREQGVHLAVTKLAKEDKLKEATETEKEGHEDEIEDKKLVKKMVKKDCLKTEGFADQFFEGEIIREEIELPELQEADKNYDAYFRACMKKAGITSIADLKTDEAKKEFMNKVDAGFSAKNEDVLYEEFMRTDIDQSVQQHRKAGHKVDSIIHKIYQGKPYAEYTVTTPDGIKKKYIYHGNIRRQERVSGE